MHSPRLGDDDGPAVKRNTVVDRTAHNHRDNVLPAYLVGQETLDIALLSVAGRCSAGKRARPVLVVSFARSIHKISSYYLGWRGTAICIWPRLRGAIVLPWIVLSTWWWRVSVVVVWVAHVAECWRWYTVGK